MIRLNNHNEVLILHSRLSMSLNSEELAAAMCVLYLWAGIILPMFVCSLEATGARWILVSTISMTKSRLYTLSKQITTQTGKQHTHSQSANSHRSSFVIKAISVSRHQTNSTSLRHFL